MRPLFRSREGDRARENPKLQQSKHEAQLERTTAAFHSHMDSMMSRLKEWPELLQGGLSLHPKPSPDFGVAAEGAVEDLRIAVNAFCSVMNSLDDKMARKLVDSGDLGKAVAANNYMPLSTTNRSVGTAPVLRSRDTVRLYDVASSQDAERWNKRHHTADADDLDCTMDAGEAEATLDASDQRWRERCPSGVLNPQDPWRRRWDKFVVILVVADTLIVPFQLAYLPYQPHSFLMLTWPWVLTLFFVADMLLSFNTGYRANSEDGERPGMLITDKAKIARRYINSRAFLLDLVTTLPWSQILIAVLGVPWLDSWKEQIVLITGLARLIRLLRLAKLIYVVERVEESLSSVTQLHVAAILRILGTTFFFCHFNACVWWIMGQARHPLAAFMSKEANERYEALPHWTTLERSGGHDFQSWTWADQPVFNAYAFCFYWTLGVMRTMPSEVFPANIQERVYVMILMFVALSLFAVSIAQVTQTFTKFTERRRTFKEELLALRLYMKTIGAPDALQEDVVSYSKHLFQRGLVNAKESGLMSRLPASLSRDLHSAHVESYIMRLPTFAEWPQRSLRQVSAIAEVKHIVRGTVLSQRNVEAIGVWVLMSGHLEVFRPSSQGLIPSAPATPQVYRASYASLPSSESPQSPGGAQDRRHWAPLEAVDESCLASEDTIQSTTTVLASCCCEVLFIPKDGFFALLAQHPSLSRLHSGRPETPAAAGSGSEQSQFFSLQGFRSSMNWSPAARSSAATRSSGPRSIMLVGGEASTPPR